MQPLMFLRILVMGALVLSLGLLAAPAVSASHEPDCGTEAECYGDWADYWVWQTYRDLKDPPCTCPPDT